MLVGQHQEAFSHVPNPLPPELMGEQLPHRRWVCDLFFKIGEN